MKAKLQSRIQETRPIDSPGKSKTTEISIPVVDPWCYDFAYNEESLKFPKKILYIDYLCLSPIEDIDLSGWAISLQVLSIISISAKSLLLNKCTGVSSLSLFPLRGHTNLMKLSLEGTKTLIDKETGEILSSIKNLVHLNLSSCTIRVEAVNTIGQTLRRLKSLNLSRSLGFDNYCMYSLGQMIERFRMLQILDFSYCVEFSDEGLLYLAQTGFNILTDINLNHCKQLTTLSIAGMRSKMSVLRYLYMKNLSFGASSYDWLSEGCRLLFTLNLSQSANLTDANLMKIGRWCRFLTHLDLSYCSSFSDEGIVNFFKSFSGKLEYLDLSGCVHVADEGIKTLAESASSSTLAYLKLTGLSNVSSIIMLSLFDKMEQIKSFAMNSELKTISSHRKSMMPHFSDVILIDSINRFTNLLDLELIGCGQISDTGMACFLKNAVFLQSLNVSNCNGLTDITLIILAKYSRCLQSLNMSGCIGVTNFGIKGFSAKENPLVMKSIELNGCYRITDESMSSLSIFKNLEFISLKSCDQITDKGVSLIFENCNKLTRIDIMNLDMISLSPIENLFRNNQMILYFNGQGCSFTPKEFHFLNQKLPLPFAHSLYSTQSMLYKRSISIRTFNKYVLQMRKIINYHIPKLFSFHRYIQATYFQRISKHIRRQQLKKLKTIFNEFKHQISIQKRFKDKNRRLKAALIIQYQLPRIYSIHLARKKVKLMKESRRSCINIQKAFRGFMVRKRCRARFQRLFYFYNCIGHLVIKYELISHIRNAFYKLIILQSFARMVPSKANYRIFQNGIRLFQRFIKSYLVYTKFRKIYLELKRKYHNALHAKKCDAVSKIEKNYKAFLFNKMMPTFILTCCIYYRNEYDEHLWSSTIIQRNWRGFHVRLLKWRKWDLEKRREISAINIQKSIRGALIFKRYSTILTKYIRAHRNLKKTLNLSRPKLRLGLYCKRIQRKFRLYIFLKERHKAASDIQRMIRGFLGRLKWTKLVKELHHMYANRIKRAYYLFQCRKARKAILHRQHMAAFKIYLMVDRFFEIQRKQKRKALVEKQRRENLNRMKEEKLFVKRTEIVSKIRDRYLNQQAKNIQNAYKRYRKALFASRLSRSHSLKSQSSNDESSKYIAPKPNKILKALQAPIILTRGLANKVSSLFGDTDIIPKRDERKLKNAVLKYQIKSILQEGIVNLNLTLGERELKAFELSQAQLKNAHLPFFVKIDQDLSGNLNLAIYIWVMYGEGKDCITELSVSQRPDKISNEAMKLRQAELWAQGVRLIWHPNIHFEFQGVCAAKQGRAAFAIHNLFFSTTFEEGENNAIAGFVLIQDFNLLGMGNVILWSTSRTLEDENQIFKFNRITAQPWCDERLLKTVKAFILSEADVLSLRRIFENMLFGRNTDVLRVEELFLTIDFPYNKLSRWVVEAIQPTRKRELFFSEYVHLVCYFVMLSSKDLTRFLFQHADELNKQFLNREQFNKLLQLLAEDGPFNVLAWEYQYDKFHDKKLKFQFIKNFDDFINQNPGALWKPQLLQQKLKKANLGINYWEKKMEQYRLIRENLGIRLI